jgi:two-component system sensor histidine kinase PhoQ
LVLTIFLVATGSVLDNAFLESARLSLRERMLGQMYQLLSASEIDKATGKLTMPLPMNLPYSQLALPDSGIFAFITRNDEPQPLWRSPSLNDKNTPSAFVLQAGEKRWHEIKMADGKDYYLLGFGFQRTVTPGIYSYNFHLAHELAPWHEQIYLYRCRLWGGLAASAILLFATQILVLRWGLAPLRNVSQELNAIKAGDSNQINGQYPREIRKLTDNINNLLKKEHDRQTRYRNALADLAHSLKTPLAVLSGAVKETSKLPAVVIEQTNRMLRIVERQLQRAGAAGTAVTLPPVFLYQVAERIIPSLKKVYGHKTVVLCNRIDPGLAVRCDEADLIEIMGNLLDNAFKDRAPRGRRWPRHPCRPHRPYFATWRAGR